MTAFGRWLRWSGLALALWSAPASAECIAQARGFNAKDHEGKPASIDLPALACGATPGGPAVLLVEFQQLSVQAASVLIDNKMTPEMRAALGAPLLFRNDVADELAVLLQRFGRRIQRECDAREGCNVFSVSDGRSNGKTLSPVSNQRRLSASTLEFTFSYGRTYFNEMIRRARDWPQGMALHYGDPFEDKDPVRVFQDPSKRSKARFLVSFEKFLTADELARAGDELLRDTQAAAGSKGVSKQEASRARAFAQKQFALERYLSRNGLPQDFLKVAGSPAQDGCGDDLPPAACCWDVHVPSRTARLAVVTIENVSASTQRLVALEGTGSTEMTLRPAASSQATRRQTAGIELKPRERLIIPTRILLTSPDGVEDDSSFTKEIDEKSRALHAEIGAAPAGVVFQAGRAGVLVRKAKEGFPAPSKLRLKDYVYGPELVPTAINLDGQVISLAPSASDRSSFIELTLESEIGSCPYLHVWNDEASAWSSTGKILDKAKGRALEQTESRTFSGLVTRFRLSEVEPEIAYIDHATLKVELRTGRSLAIASSEPRLRTKDGRYLTLPWGASHDFGFRLPPGVRRADVVTSTISLTGYYERYGALLAQRQERREAMGRP